jgi:hypothetical protein
MDGRRHDPLTHRGFDLARIERRVDPPQRAARGNLRLPPSLFESPGTLSQHGSRDHSLGLERRQSGPVDRLEWQRALKAFW